MCATVHPQIINYLVSCRMFDKHLEKIDSPLDEAVPGCRLLFVMVISTHWFVPIFVNLLDSVRFCGDQFLRHAMAWTYAVGGASTQLPLSIVARDSSRRYNYTRHTISRKVISSETAILNAHFDCNVVNLNGETTVLLVTSSSGLAWYCLLDILSASVSGILFPGKLLSVTHKRKLSGPLAEARN